MRLAPTQAHTLAALLESTEEAVLSVCLDGTIETWSAGAEALYGYKAEEIVGQPLVRLAPLFEVESLERLLRDARQKKVQCCETGDRLRQDGRLVRVALRRRLILDEHGQPEGLLECGRQQQTEPAMQPGRTPAETQLKLLVAQMPVVLWTTDAKLRLTSSWGSRLRLFNTELNELIGKSLFECLQCDDVNATPIAQHCAALRGASSHFEFAHKGRVLDVRLEPLRRASGAVVGCIGVGLDVTERKRTEEEMRYQATHDALTGLANYREFLDTLEREVKRAARSHQPFAILLLDLDDLKKINDRLGHLAGNRSLKRLASVMKEHCRSTDLAARYGGDEFAVVLLDADTGMARHVAERIETCLRNDSEKPALTVSIGAAVFPEDGRGAQELLEAADQQLYKRKRASHQMRATVK